MLTRQQLGRRHQCRLRAALDGVQHRQQRDDSLAAADVPLQQAEHARGLRHVGGDLRECRRLRAGELKTEPLDHVAGELAGDADRPAGLPSQPAADDRERQLVGEQLVKGQARPRRRERREIAVGGRRMRLDQGLAPARPVLSGTERRVEPLVEDRRALQSGLDHLQHHLAGEAGGERVDRLDRGQAFLIRVGQHVIGMHHLQSLAERVNHAADDPCLARRQRLQQVLGPGVEEHQDQLAAGVAAENPVGPAARSRRLVFEDTDAQRRRPARLNAVDRGREPTIDDALRQMPEQIDNARPGELAQRLSHEWPDAGQRVDGREQGKQDGWAHRADETADSRAGGHYMLPSPTMEAKE